MDEGAKGFYDFIDNRTAKNKKEKEIATDNSINVFEDLAKKRNPDYYANK